MTDEIRQHVADMGERLAARWLEERGWEILHTNWSQKIGELDIVATRMVDWGEEQVPLIAFVEVKTSDEASPILPEARVNHRKRRKIVTLAKLYLTKLDASRVRARFDVIGVDLDTEEVRHYPAAFDASGRLR